MPGSAIRLNDLPDELRRIHGRIRAAAVRGCRLAAREAQAEVIREIGRVKPRPPSDTGEMKRAASWPITNLPDGAVLESGTKQAVFQEYGTKRFTPPMEPLRAWARRKLRGGGRRKPRRKVGEATKWRRAAERHMRRAQTAAGLGGGGKAPLGGKSTNLDPKAAARATARRSAREAKREKAVEALARAAWASIRKKGIIAKGFYRRAAARFPMIVERRVRAELRKVSR